VAAPIPAPATVTIAEWPSSDRAMDKPLSQIVSAPLTPMYIRIYLAVSAEQRGMLACDLPLERWVVRVDGRGE
jgi:hypothetical protein